MSRIGAITLSSHAAYQSSSVSVVERPDRRLVPALLTRMSTGAPAALGDPLGGVGRRDVDPVASATRAPRGRPRPPAASGDRGADAARRARDTAVAALDAQVHGAIMSPPGARRATDAAP